MFCEIQNIRINHLTLDLADFLGISLLSVTFYRFGHPSYEIILMKEVDQFLVKGIGVGVDILSLFQSLPVA